MDWNEYFMGIAEKVALKSKDTSTKVGCVIVSEDKTPISFGFNGWVRGCDESHMTWDRPLKYHMVIHAEMNAIMFSKQSLKGARLYCTHYPCDNCLKHILQSGIREIFYKSDEVVKRFEPNSIKAIQRLIKATNATILKI